MSHPREEILSRLRRAGGGAPEPREDGFTHPGKSVPNLSLFMERAHEAGATVMVSSREQAGRTLMEYLGSDVAAQMVFSDEPVVQSIRTQLEAAGVSNTRAEKPLRTFTQDKLTRVCMKASVGLTGVDQAVSSTGTLLLSNSPYANHSR